jgi:DUF4097 and DUF4098 domain-containing protein YvlB
MNSCARRVSPASSALILALAAVLGLCQPAPAGETIDRTHKVNKDAIITIDNLAGSVTVTGWNRNEVKITGALDEQAEGLQVEGDADRLAIEVKYPKRMRGNVDGSRLEIQVPAGSRLEIRSVSADVTLDNVEGAVEINTVSGEVKVRGKPASLRAESISGGLDVVAESAKIVLRTISGAIDAAGEAREFSCNSISGGIDVTADKNLATLSCETISGNVVVKGPIARKAEWELATHSGDVKLELAGKIDARFRVSTFSGRIADVFGQQPARTSRYVPGQELNHTEGDGGALIKVDAFSGNVRIERR